MGAPVNRNDKQIPDFLLEKVDEELPVPWNLLGEAAGLPFFSAKFRFFTSMLPLLTSVAPFAAAALAWEGFTAMSLDYTGK